MLSRMVVLLALVSGCTATNPDLLVVSPDMANAPLCVPGRSVACVGTAGCAGGQTCNVTGTGFAECICGAPVTDLGDMADPPVGADMAQGQDLSMPQQGDGGAGGGGTSGGGGAGGGAPQDACAGGNSGNSCVVGGMTGTCLAGVCCTTCLYGGNLGNPVAPPPQCAAPSDPAHCGVGGGYCGLNCVDSPEACTVGSCSTAGQCVHTTKNEGTVCGNGIQHECHGSTCTACGVTGETCCTNSTSCTGTDGYCNAANTCDLCGGSGDSCCGGNTCDSGLTCAGGSCLSCGGANQACCPGANECGNGLTCDGGQCHACGLAQQACCLNGRCGPGLFCNGLGDGSYVCE